MIEPTTLGNSLSESWISKITNENPIYETNYKDWNHSGNITLVDKVTALRRHFFYWVPHPRRPVLVSVLSPLFMTSIERNKEHDGKGDNSISLYLTRRTICAMNV